jgi:hypothetical protein
MNMSEDTYRLLKQLVELAGDEMPHTKRYLETDDPALRPASEAEIELRLAAHKKREAPAEAIRVRVPVRDKAGDIVAIIDMPTKETRDER